jgi:hypothetical protein
LGKYERDGVIPCYMTIFRTREGAGKEGAARI